MADNDQSLYTLRYNQITKALEGQGGTPSWNPLITGGSSTFIPGNIRYVDALNGSDSNTGGPSNPFQTVQAACNSIGSATTALEYTDETMARCLVIVAPGTYTEDVVLPQRQIVGLQLQNALIIGNVTQSFDGLLATGTITQHKVIIAAQDERSVYTGAGIPLVGIQGSFTMVCSNPSGQAMLEVWGCGITGDIVADSTIGSYTLQVSMTKAMCLGDIKTQNSNTITLYASDCDTSSTKNLGGVQGHVTLYQLRNVRFSRPVVASGLSGGRWFDVEFFSGANDFTNYAGTISADANSYSSFLARVPTKGTVSFILLDDASGIAYTPKKPGDWSSVPSTVQGGLDFLVTNASAVASMPRANLAVEFLMDEGVGTLVRNTVSPVYPNNNLIGPSEQFFTAWGGAATDISAINPYGDYTASRFLAAGGSNVYLVQSNYPYIAGQAYTLSIWVKSNTGIAQKIRMSDDQAGFSADIDVTLNWTRVFTTFTASATGYVIPVAVDAALNATDILIWGVQLELGSVPTTYVQQSFQMVFGAGPQYIGSGPSWIPEGLDFTAHSGVSSCLALSQTPLNISNTTVYTVIRQTTAPVLSGYGPIFSDPFTLAKFYLALNGTGSGPLQPRFKFNGGQAVAGLTNISDGAWYILAARYDGTNMDIFVNGSRVCRTAATLAPIQVKQLFLSNFNYNAYFPGSIGYVSLYSVAHTDLQMANNTSIIESVMAARKVTVVALPKFIVFEGDSITALGNYAYTALAALPTFIQGALQAVSGSSIADMVARASITDSYYNASRTLNILSVLIGANDLAGLGATAWKVSLKSYCLARKAVGWKIVLLTVLPQTTGGFNAVRNTANGLIRGDSSFYDALADIASDATIGQDSDAANTSYYSDGVHPTAAADALMASYVTAAIETL